MSNVRDKEYIIAFGKNLAKIRSEKGLTQQELAYRSDVERTQISRIERGEVNCTISMVKVLSNALNIHPSDMLTFDIPFKDTV